MCPALSARRYPPDAYKKELRAGVKVRGPGQHATSHRGHTTLSITSNLFIFTHVLLVFFFCGYPVQDKDSKEEKSIEELIKEYEDDGED